MADPWDEGGGTWDAVQEQELPLTGEEIDALPWATFDEGTDRGSVAGGPSARIYDFTRSERRPDEWIVTLETGERGVWYSPSRLPGPFQRFLDPDVRIPYPNYWEGPVIVPGHNSPGPRATLNSRGKQKVGEYAAQEMREAVPGQSRPFNRQLATRNELQTRALVPEASPAGSIYNDYLYQSEKPWEARPWVRQPEGTIYRYAGAGTPEAALAQWRDRVFALYGLRPDMVRQLENTQLQEYTGGRQSWDPEEGFKYAGNYSPWIDTIDLTYVDPALALHEYTHAADRDQVLAPEAYRPDFQAALAQLRTDESGPARSYRGAVTRYPGAWDRLPWEAYAQIAQQSAGRLEGMPAYLQPFYQDLFTGKHDERFYQPVFRGY